MTLLTSQSGALGIRGGSLLRVGPEGTDCCPECTATEVIPGCPPQRSSTALLELFGVVFHPGGGRPDVDLSGQYVLTDGAGNVAQYAIEGGIPGSGFGVVVDCAPSGTPFSGIPGDVPAWILNLGGLTAQAWGAFADVVYWFPAFQEELSPAGAYSFLRFGNRFPASSWTTGSVVVT